MTAHEDAVEVPRPRAGRPEDPAVLTALRQADLRPIGYLTNASNHTLYCELGDSGLAAVYKPQSGERPLWDFPLGSLCRREVAAYVVSEALGWALVPPTVLREGPVGMGSAQLFVPHDPRLHYFALVEDRRHHPTLARMALFDLLVNNTDRKGSHVLLGEEDGRLYGIDHGLTFHPQPKLRTVIWELAGMRVDPRCRTDLGHLAETLTGDAGPVTGELCELLSAQEVARCAARAARLRTIRALPEATEDSRSYPWPPL
ncbi:MAG: SCO1664 family protein [Nitriliruptorales bacterium]|nr:SCO1664 family protein [Nitriliruptorales bacterium]